MSVLEELQRRVTRRHLIAVALAGAVGAAGVGWLATQQPAAALPLQTAQSVDPPAAPVVLVFVSGAVVHPGLYRLSPDARVADAIAAAGGVTVDADPGHLPNLAARVHDGRQVNVPFRKSTTSTALKLDINAAAEDELAAVPGMPDGLAQAIVDYRDTWGPFATLTQLHTDLGVDTATERELAAYIKVVPPQQ